MTTTARRAHYALGSIIAHILTPPLQCPEGWRLLHQHTSSKLDETQSVIDSYALYGADRRQAVIEISTNPACPDQKILLDCHGPFGKPHAPSAARAAALEVARLNGWKIAKTSWLNGIRLLPMAHDIK